MRKIPFILACLFFVWQPAAARAGCLTDQYGGLVCGDDKDAVRVFDDTTAPSKKYAFAWRCEVGLPICSKEPGGDVEHVLIRLPDGEVLGSLPGDYWDTGARHANRYEVFAAWSPDSRAAVEGSNGRWDTDAFAYFAVDGGKATKLDLLALVSPTIKAKLPASRREGHAFRVRNELPIKLDAHGRLGFTVMLYVPKQDVDAELDFAVTVDITTKGGKPVARIASARRVKVDPRL